MFKRMWKANRIFTLLFLISFSLTFGIVYYGMYLRSQVLQTDQTAEQMDYSYRGFYMVMWAGNVQDRLDVKLPELTQGILSYHLLVYGEDIVGVKSAYVVMDMQENFLEPLEQGEYFKEGKKYDMPQCIIGDAWLENAKRDGPRTTISISGHDCEVTGILAPNTFTGSDDRIFLYGPSLTQEFLGELVNINQGMEVDYRIPVSADEEQIKRFKDWLEGGIFESTDEFPYMDGIDGGVTKGFQDVMPMYNAFFMFMVVFCFINCAFLTCVWCTKKLQENMIKRVFGFGMMQIWLEGFLEIALYEGVSIIISSIICLFIEAMRGRAMNFFITWRYGIGIMVAVLLLFTFILSIINISYLNKMKPADTLKATE